MTILTKYNNGNTVVTIFNDGTKIREYDSDPKPIHPESIDVKITNWCDGGCKWCHEASNTNGKHADITKLMDILCELPSGVEIAIGGGNPLAHPDLDLFLTLLNHYGFIANMTVNSIHLHQESLKYLKQYLSGGQIKGLGVSLTHGVMASHIKELLEVSDNIVFHLVMGINDPDMISLLHLYCQMMNKDCKVLVLGYKQIRSGLSFYDKTPAIEENKNKWYREIRKFFGKSGLVISFDNLAIEQLNLKRFFNAKAWDKFYMGDDGTFSMYIDGVNEQYAVSSTSLNRKSFNDYTVCSFFNSIDKMK